MTHTPGQNGGDRRPGGYSPERRTGLVLCGTGAHGAYHAGVLRAFQEAGVKIDLVAGSGIGAGAAALFAIDGASRLWEPDGIWPVAADRLYTWNAFLRAAGWLAVLFALVVLVPALVLVAALVVYIAGFLLTLLGVSAGAALIAGYTAWMQSAFSSDQLPTIVPRLTLVILFALALMAGATALVSRLRARAKRRAAGGWWWVPFGAPIDPSGAHAAFVDAIWGLIRGAASPASPAPATVGRRYAEVLAENVGQPGFRELILTATDLDARRDLVLAMLREPYGRNFLGARPGADRRAEVVDLVGAGRDHAVDLLAGALTPPVLAPPALVTFPVDSYWRGETHRVTDRPGAVLRLLDEVAAAGVTQVIVVSGVEPRQGPHMLTAPRLDPRHRLGELLATTECIALRDALEEGRRRFDAVHLVCPVHNPIGPFDFRGTYDEASDRHHTLAELVDRGYDDAYRQFIEPVVGASGEQLARTREDEPRLTR